VPTRTEALLAELKNWCDAKYGRQSEPARILGTYPQTVNDWFTGRKTPTLEQGLAIQEFLEQQKKSKSDA
jgi:DNA-binding transcriptional regulator YdaS (Cro superfamily)